MALTVQTIDRKIWRTLAPSFLDYNYRQLWGFGVACADRLKAASEHVAVYDNSEPVALADVRIKEIPMLKTGIAYVTGGPLVRRQGKGLSDSGTLAAVLEALTGKYVRQNKLVLRIHPPISPKNWEDIQCEIYQKLGYREEPQLHRYRTFNLEISESSEVIRKQLKQKWRNCLNNAEKRGLTVEIGTSERLFAMFLDLYRELKSRKKFEDDLSPEFYQSVQKGLSEDEKFIICIVFEGEQPVAGHVSSALGDTCVYLLGATSNTGLRNKSAYLAQWSVIQLAKERGCKFYDLGGIDPDANPGVYRFKKGLGGMDITSPGPFEIYPNRMKKHTVRCAENAYRWLRSK